MKRHRSSETYGTSKNIEVNNNKRQDKRKRFDDFRYGNYRNYYYKRLGSGEHHTDIRLKILEAHAEYFKDKTVLDIGCNSGFITVNVAKSLLPASVLGIDIDEKLISVARRDLEKEKTEDNLSEQQIVALNRVTFRQANYILKDESLLQYEKPQYDVILCLSVTKWIHLNHGDKGIKFLFKRIFKQVKPNGVLILEAQAFDTYKKRSKLSPEIQDNYKGIRLKPEAFESFLLSDEIGFAESFCISDVEQLESSIHSKGFRRPLQMFVKRENNKESLVEL